MQKTYLHVINETLDEFLATDPKGVLIGEDIGFYGGAFGVTKNLFKKYGAKRIIDTPMSEQALVGLGIGAAMNGLRPVVELMFIDFITLAYDQLFNHAGIFSYSTSGEVFVPLVLRVPAGAGRGYGATHSKTLIAPLMHIPGIKIVFPSNPSEVGGLLKASLIDKNPVIFVEHKLLYSKVAQEEIKDFVPLGKANVVKEGKDVLVITYGKSVFDSLDVAKKLEGEGISLEIIDLRTLKPLDMETVNQSVRKIGKVLVVDEGFSCCGVASEISSRILEDSFFSLDAPIKKICCLDVPIPCSPKLESEIVPNIEKIENGIRGLLDE